ncbi:hypothetical protein [Nocardioides currus]|uniref:hypothetical protein n=1 Tax=Nocardioides currus TaxID=2133958 RepID=UPI001056FA26|nr:hypothetical protein [Nocardioides currus]
MRSLVVLAGLLLLAGCADDQGGGGERTEQSEACSLLSDVEVEDLAGQEITARRDEGIGELPGCAYRVGDAGVVQVVQVRARQ